MISSNINTTTMLIFSGILIIALLIFIGYAFVHSNNTETLADAVRTSLIDNRDDSARVNSHTLYALDVPNFEREVKQTKLSEVQHGWGIGSLDRDPNGNANFKFYYLLQNGQLYDTDTYQKKLKDGSNDVINRDGKTTLVKAVTVDVTLDKNQISRKGIEVYNAQKDRNEKAVASKDGRSRRYSVTYIIDGGLVKNPASDTDEASRLLPDSYQDPNKQGQMVGDQGGKLKSNTMINVTDN